MTRTCTKPGPIRCLLCCSCWALFLPAAPALFGQSLSAGAPATLPNGRRITPQGSWTKLAPYPFALVVSGDGRQIAIPSIGWPFSLNTVNVEKDVTTQHGGRVRRNVPSRVRRIPPGLKNDPDVQVLTGVAYSPDGALLYDATGDSGAVDVYSTRTWGRVARVSLDGMLAGQQYQQSFAASMVLAPRGDVLYVLDQANWRVVAIDTKQLRCVGNAPTGANPYGIARSPDGGRLYITNSGLFEYKAFAGADPKHALETGVTFPPFGYPSREAREGIRFEGHEVPGLGPENDPRGSSLWSYDVRSAAEPKLLTKLRLGSHIGEEVQAAASEAVGGAAPMGVVAARDRVYVALAHEDAVAVVAADGSRLIDEIALSPFVGAGFRDRHGRPLRGVMPAAVALAGERLYVTEAGINAVAVVNTSSDKVLGHIPVGWYPSGIGVSPDHGTLYVVNTKGRGSGPNGGANFTAQGQGSYIGELEFGSLSMLPLGEESGLKQATRQVIANNVAAIDTSPSLPRLQHVFLVIRENRTFDEILGDLPGANGDPKIARWGMHGWLSAAPADKTVAVTPNAHALAGRFGTSDNFFVDGDVSADGHRWVMAAEETPWFHVAWTSGYGGRRSGDVASKAPGRRALGGGADAPMPEDEPEFGTLWEHVSDAGLSIRNYGEGLEVEGSDEMDGSSPQGQRLLLNAPVPSPVFRSTDRAFPTFNLGIPDQFRFYEFAKDFGEVLAKGDAPSLVVIRLPGDHTANPRPREGYPDRASYVADNDLALGRIVETITHSRIWAESAVLVVEDDAQGGVDHVDAHRSVMLAISPYIRPGTISHRHTSMGSLQKTAYALLGIGPLNLEDALAADLGDMFQATPDLRPYDAVAPDLRVFDPAKAKLARPKNATEARALLDCDDADEIRKDVDHSAAMRRKPKEKKTGAL